MRGAVRRTRPRPPCGHSTPGACARNLTSVGPERNCRPMKGRFRDRNQADRACGSPGPGRDRPIGGLTASVSTPHAWSDNWIRETDAGQSIDRVQKPNRLAPAIAAWIHQPHLVAPSRGRVHHVAVVRDPARSASAQGTVQLMLSRSLQTTTVGRVASMRRLRRRQATTSRLFCSTNGCASFLEIDLDGSQAICPVCGFRRRLN